MFCRIVIVLLLAGNTFGCSGKLKQKHVYGKATTDIEKLISKSVTSDYMFYLMEDHIQPMCLDAGADAVPLLAQLLDSDNGPHVAMATVGLAYIGGKNAVSALRKKFERTKSEFVRHWLCFSIGSTGSPDDIEFLMTSLLDKNSGADTIKNASLSLGVLRAKEALDLLKRIADKSPTTLSSICASAAIEWIIQGEYKINISPETEQDKVLVAILKNGIVLRKGTNHLYQRDTGRRLYYGVQGWEIQKDPNRSVTFPQMSRFTVHFSPDNKSALCWISISYGVMECIFLEYVLSKSNCERWEVIGTVLIGVS